MNVKRWLVLLIICGCSATHVKPRPFHTEIYLYGVLTSIDTLTFTDSSTNRRIPIAVYNKEDRKNIKDNHHKNISKPLAIINPGYGGTRNDYGYLATPLALHGYLVVVIQHDLPTDDTLSKTGDIYQLRKPVWERGINSIRFITKKIKKEYPKLNYKNIVLLGHSNGGDMAMLMAKEQPDFAKTVISLDNRRVSFPKSKIPRVFSIRSSDQLADPGVLPSKEEQKKYGITIVKLNVLHSEMGGSGTTVQLKEICDYVLKFLHKNDNE